MKRGLISGLLAVVVAVPAAQALTLTSYTARPAWESAVAGETTIDFTSLASGTIVTTQFAGQGATFTDGDDAWLPPYLAANGSFTVSFAGAQTAIGVNYPGAIAFDLYNGTTLLGSSINFGGSGLGFFAGVVSDTPFNRAVIRDWVDDLAFIENLSFVATAVPEPSMAVLFGMGAGLLMRRTRRSR